MPPNQPTQSVGGGGGAPGPAPIPSPFSLIAPNSPNASQALAQVNPASYLQLSPTADDVLAIGGLGTDFALHVGDRIWLEIDLDGGAATEVNLQADGIAGDSWEAYPEAATWDGDGGEGAPYDQQKAYLLIAECVAATDGRPGTVFKSGDGTAAVKVLQRTNTNLRMQLFSDEAKPLYYPVPCGGPSVI